MLCAALGGLAGAAAGSQLGGWLAAPPSPPEAGGGCGVSSPVLASPATAWCAAAAASLLRLQGGLLRRGAGSGRGKGGVGMDHPHQDAHGRHAPLERQPAHCWSAAAAPPPAGPVEAVEGAEVEASAAVAEPKAGGAGGVVGSGGGVEVRDVHLQVGGHQVPLPLPLQLQAQGQAAGQTAGSSTTGSSSSGHGGVVGQVASALAALAGGGAAAAAAVEGLCAAGDSRAALTQLAPGWAVAPGVEKTAALNQLLQLLWPQLAAAGERELRAALTQALAAASGAAPEAPEAGGTQPELLQLRVTRLGLGPAAPPRIGGVRAVPGGGDGTSVVPEAGSGSSWSGGSGSSSEEVLVVELDVAWASEAEVEVEAALHPAAALPPALRRRLPAAALALLGPTALPPLRLRLRRLALRGCVRLSLGPLLPAPPYLAAVALALTQPPLLDAAADLGLGLGSGAEGAVDGRGGEWLPRLQLMALPGVRWAIHAAAQAFLQRTLLYPRHLLLQLSPAVKEEEAGEEGAVGVAAAVLAGLRRPVGVLRLRLLRAEGLQAAGVRRAAAAAGVEGGGGGSSAAFVYVSAQVRQGAVQRSPPQPVLPAAAAATGAIPGDDGGKAVLASWQQLQQSAGPAASASSASSSSVSAATAACPHHEFILPLSAPRHQRLQLRLLRDRPGWNDPCLAAASVPLAALLPALQQVAGGAPGPAGGPDSSGSGSGWVPVVAHMRRSRGGEGDESSGGGGGGAGVGGAAVAVATAPLTGLKALGRALRHPAAATAGGVSRLTRHIGRSLARVTGAGGGGEQAAEAEEGSEEGSEDIEEDEHVELEVAGVAPQAGTGSSSSTTPSARILPGSDVGGGAHLGGVGLQSLAAVHIGDQPHSPRPRSDHVRVYLQAQYLPLPPPPRPGAASSGTSSDTTSTEVAAPAPAPLNDTAAANWQQQQQLDMGMGPRLATEQLATGPMVEASAVIAGAPGAGGAGGAAGASGGGGAAGDGVRPPAPLPGPAQLAAGPALGAVVGREGEAHPQPLSTSPPAKVQQQGHRAGGGPAAGRAEVVPPVGVQVQLGAVWPVAGPSRLVRPPESVSPQEQAVLTVRVLRLRQLTAASNAAAAAASDPWVELLLLDPVTGGVAAAQRTSTRYNAAEASWEDEPALELVPAAAGGWLVARLWDATTGWEAVGRLARLDMQGGLQRPDTLLGGVRLPLLGAATAGRLRRTWLLQPAGSRTSAGAAELEMELSWCPLPPLPP